MEADVQELQAMLAAIVEGSSDAILSKDLKGVITSWNPASERLSGYSAEEALGKPVAMLAPRGLEDEPAEVLKRIVQGESVENYETVRRTKDGREIHVSLTISPIRNGQGRVVGASTIARDITERKAAQELLDQARLLLERIFRRSPAPALILSLPELRITSVNEALLALAGYAEAELRGRSFAEIGLVDAHDLSLARERLLAEPSIPFSETTLISKGGDELPVLAAVEEVFLNGERGLIVILLDDAERREAQAMLLQSLREAARETGLMAHSLASKLERLTRRKPEPQRELDLTRREREVLDLLAAGLDNSQIAERLRLSPQTVRNYVAKLYEKLGVANRGAAIVWARENGFAGRS